MRAAANIGAAAAVAAVLVGLVAWLYPRQPDEPTVPRLAGEVHGYAEASLLYTLLTSSRGRAVDLDLAFDPTVATYDDVRDGEESFSYVFVRDPHGTGTEGIQINAFGLSASNVENMVGWGGGLVGIVLRGTYRVADFGIGTGGVLWVALQAHTSPLTGGASSPSGPGTGTAVVGPRSSEPA